MSTAPTPLVHIVDDDEAIRDSLSFMFATSGVTARTYASPLELLRSAGGLTSGCIVTDVRMPEMDGIELVRRLGQGGCRLPVIVMTGHGDVPMAVAAMKAGAVDFLEKPFDDETMLAAVKGALSRVDRPASPGLSPDVQQRLDSLSERERQVLDGLVEGKLNKIIAYELGISPRTVEIYRAKLMSKMEAPTFADLIRMVLGGRA